MKPFIIYLGTGFAESSDEKEYRFATKEEMLSKFEELKKSAEVETCRRGGVVMMRVLIACEFSGVVRRAFRDRGHDAWSCDLLPAEDGSPNHIQQTVAVALEMQWDKLVAHPPCTFLCNSGAKWLYVDGQKKNGKNHQRWSDMYAACDFFAALYWSDVPQVCIENPIMHWAARDYLMSRHGVPTYSQTIQPYEHGHGETKRTGLWLRGLPLLKPSDPVSGRVPRVHYASPGPDRWKERSRTLEGIAKAFADQWGSLE